MQEIASSLDAVGLPDGFHRGAADIYQRLAEFKHCEPAPTLAEVLAAARKRGRK